MVAGQTMVWGLAFNLTPPAFGSQAYLLVHGWLIFSTLLVFALLGPGLIQSSWVMIRERRLAVEGLFLLTATGAFVGSLVATFRNEGSVYYEVVAIVLAVYTVGKWVGQQSRSRAMKAAGDYEEAFDTATRVSSCGHVERVQVDRIRKGEWVQVLPGEPFTVDGQILRGTGYVKETAVTGEPGPVLRVEAEHVMAGTWAIDAAFTVEVKQTKGERVIDQIIKTVREAPGHPSRLQQQADRLTQIFLPLVVTISVLTFVGWSLAGPWDRALFNSMAVLLVACPCALGLATPIAVWSGLLNLSRMGLVSKSAKILDVLAGSRRWLFDKTGTLSRSNLEISEFVPCPGMAWTEEALYQLVLSLESRHAHPVGDSVARWIRGKIDFDDGLWSVLETQLHSGRGISGRLLAREGTPELESVGAATMLKPVEVFVGELDDVSCDWLKEAEVRSPSKKRVYVLVKGEVMGAFFMTESLHSEVREVFRKLQSLGIQGEVLTGDPASPWEEIEGFPVRMGQSPEDKAKAVRDFAEKGQDVLFVGDGINDAGAMALASGSLAVDSGSQLTQATGTGVLVGESLELLPEAVRLARNIQGKIWGNLIFAATYNLIGMGLAAAGLLHPVVAALLMVGSSILVSSRAVYSARILPIPEKDFA